MNFEELANIVEACIAHHVFQQYGRLPYYKQKDINA
jgi:hypothetical protein